jgi:hypothetical protein
MSSESQVMLNMDARSFTLPAVAILFAPMFAVIAPSPLPHISYKKLSAAMQLTIQVWRQGTTAMCSMRQRLRQ